MTVISVLCYFKIW